MSDYDLPELPSDEELGITDEDREQYGEELPDDGPEMSEAELAELLGESSREVPKSSPPPSGSSGLKTAPGEQSKVRRKAAREVRKAEKGVRKAEKARSREEARAAKDAEREARAREKEEKAAARKARAEERKEAAGAELDVPAWRGPATLVALLAFAVFSSSRTGLPGPAPANAPDSAFSSARAMATLVELARAPHPTGSPEHVRVRELLVGRLAELGIESEIQTATSVLPAPRVRVGAGVERVTDFVRTATVRNVVARVPGTESTGTVLVTAHYDSREIAVGAADDGAGLVTILEALRALRTGEPLRNDLIVLFTDAEELGLLGARAFVDGHRWMEDVELVLAFEMRGAGGPSIMFETNELNGWVVQALQEFDPAPFAYSLAHEVYRRMPNDTDFTPFREAGVQGLNFAAIDDAHVYHQPYDTPENLSESTLQHHGIRALAALRWFGEADLSSVNAPNRVYFSLPVVGLVTYPQPVVHVFSAVLLGLFALLTIVARRGGARPVASLAGLGLTLALAAGAWVVGAAAPGRLRPFHAETGALHGSLFHAEGWYVLALALATLSVAAAMVAVARRWISRDELALGALALPVLGALALGVLAPLGAAHLQLPALAGLLAALVLALLGARASSTLAWLLALVVLLPLFLILVPTVELVWLALTLGLLGPLGALVALGLMTCLPALDALRSPNPWWAPATTALAAALSIGVGVALARPSAEHPMPTTLAYAYAHGSGEAMWITAPAADVLASAESRAWAEERAGGTFDENRDLEEFGYLPGSVPVRRAPVVAAQRPEVEVLRDSIVGSERLVRLAVRSAVGAERLGFQLDGGTRLRAINEVVLEDSEVIRRADHWGVPEGAVVLDLTMPAVEPIGVHVIEHLLRPEELVGREPFARPPTMAADVTRLSDRVMLRFSVAAFVDPRHAFVSPTGGTDTGTPADTLVIGAPADTSATAPVADTTAEPGTPAPDSSVAPDTSAMPDSSAAPDTGAIQPDTAGGPTPTGPDTAPPDTVAARGDTIR